MMQEQIKIKKLTQQNFAPFGDMIAVRANPDFIINQGMCARFHDLASLSFDTDGRAGISVFDATPRSLPYELVMMERHPLGSQAFLPLHAHPFLVIVAQDDDGKPGTVQAFETPACVGVNYHKNIWHGVLTPLASPGLFAVVDRIGTGNNLEEFWFETPYLVCQ